MVVFRGGRWEGKLFWRTEEGGEVRVQMVTDRHGGVETRVEIGEGSNGVRKRTGPRRSKVRLCRRGDKGNEGRRDGEQGTRGPSTVPESLQTE